MKNKKLDELYLNSKRMNIDDATKIVIMSDCHRGSGDNYDNFLKNENIYEVAMKHYYKEGYTYIELGDGDDMWEVTDYNEIIEEHIDTFKLLGRFHQDNRLIMIYGNHDMEKKYKQVLEKYFYTYYDKNKKESDDLLAKLEVQESIVLNYKGQEIFLLHGHQADYLNSTLWRLSRFLVRNVWRKLEYIGLKDSTMAARNYSLSKRIEKRFHKWSIKNKVLLVAGHTHRPIIPHAGESLYFNDGSCIHPNGITCIEIEKGRISLVKWEYDIDDDNKITIKRKVLDGSVPIELYLNNSL